MSDDELKSGSERIHLGKPVSFEFGGEDFSISQCTGPIEIRLVRDPDGPQEPVIFWPSWKKCADGQWRHIKIDDTGIYVDDKLVYEFPAASEDKGE